MKYQMTARIGLTSSDGKTRYDSALVKTIYAASLAAPLGLTLTLGSGHDHKRKKWEQSISLLGTWEVSGRVELSAHCNRLNDFFRRIFAELRQEWIQLVYATETNPLGVVDLYRDSKPTLTPDDLVEQPIVNITSAFGLDVILGRGTHDIFVIGQVLRYLVVAEPRDKYKKMFFDFLRASNDRHVRIMICDPRVKSAVQAWEMVVGKRYKSHLARSLKEFKSWVSEAREEGLDGFETRVTRMCPLTMTFIDASLNGASNGLLALTPVIHPVSEFRPCFVLKQNVAQHRAAFCYYYKMASVMYSDHKRTRSLG